MRELTDPARGSTVMLPDDDRLIGELAAPKWTMHNGSVIAVESKDDIRSRLGRSTDRADSVISSFFNVRRSARCRAEAARSPGRPAATPSRSKRRLASLE
jgi:hypothetical protein